MSKIQTKNNAVQNEQRMTPCNVRRAREIIGAPSDAAVYMMVARRQIPFRKNGNTVRGRLVFFEEELREFVRLRAEQQTGVRLSDLF
jgi:hypothetical protein